MGSIARNHLRFLQVRGAWMPALIFEEYAVATNIFQKVPIEGSEKILDDMTTEYLNRYRSNPQSVSCRFALVLGDSSLIVWEEDIKELRCFYSFLQKLTSDPAYNTNSDWNNAMDIAGKFLQIPQPVGDDFQQKPSAPTNVTQYNPSKTSTLYSREPVTELTSIDSPTVNESVDERGDGEEKIESTNQTSSATSIASSSSSTSLGSSVMKKENRKGSKKGNRPKSSILHIRSKHSHASDKSSSADHRIPKGVKFSQVEPNKVPSPREVQPIKFSQVRNSSQQEIVELNKVPTTREVQPILSKLGYKSANSKYYRPRFVMKDKKNLIEGVHYFSSASELRHFLCRRGVESLGDVKLSSDQKELLRNWVRYSICPALRNVESIPEEATKKPLGSIHEYLLKLGFLYRNNNFFLPGSDPRIKLGLALNGFEIGIKAGIETYLCRYGLPESSNFKGLTEIDRLRVELFLTDCPHVDTFEFISDEEMDTKYKLALAEATKPPNASIATPLATNRSNNDAAVVTVTHADDNGRIASDSTAVTIVTDCGDSASEKLVEDGEIPHVSDVNHSQSPVHADGNMITEICSGPQSTPLGLNPSKELFNSSPIEIRKAREGPIVEGKVEQLDSMKSNTKKACLVVDVATPLQGIGHLSRNMSPDQDTMDKEMESFAPLPVDEKGSPDAEHLFKTYEESTFMNNSGSEDFFLTQDNRVDSAQLSHPIGDAVSNVVLGVQVSEKNGMSSNDASRCVSAATDSSSVDHQMASSNYETACERWLKRLEGLIYPNDTWETVFKLMKDNGLYWTYSTASILHDRAYVFPGGRVPIKGGIEGHDFCNGDLDLKSLAINFLTWNGDGTTGSLLVEQDMGRRSRKRTHSTASVQSLREDSKNLNKKEKKPKKDKCLESPTQSAPSNPRSSPALKTPETKPTIGEALRSCQRVLQTSHGLKKISNIDAGSSTKFKSQVEGIDKFLRGTISSKGSHGATKDDIPVLYICGSPGVGKTSAVNWCCDQAERAVRKGEFDGVDAVRVCRVKAVDSSDILNKILPALGAGSTKSFRSILKDPKRSQDLLVLVIDEVDNLVSVRGGASDNTVSEALLQELLALATDSCFNFSFIGISNAVDNLQAKKLKKLGMTGRTIPFAPYGKKELVNLVISRIGNSIVDHKAMEFLASKVAAKCGDARMMLDLVVKAVSICYDCSTDSRLKERRQDKAIVTIHHALTAVKAIFVKFVERVDALPEMAKLVLCVAVTICSHSSANYTMGRLRELCSSVAEHEGLERLDFDTFKQLVQQLIDHGLLLANDDVDSDIGSRGAFALQEMQVRFGSQLQDVEAAISDRLEFNPIYKKLIDAVKNDSRNRPAM